MAETDIAGLTVTIDPSSFSGIGKTLAIEFANELAGGAMDSIKRVFGDTIVSAFSSGADNFKQQVGILSGATAGGANAVSSPPRTQRSYFSDDDAESMKKLDVNDKIGKVVERGSSIFTANLNADIDEDSLQKNITSFVTAANTKLNLQLDDAQTDNIVKQIKSVATTAKSVFEGVFSEPGESILKEVLSAKAFTEASELAKKGFEKIKSQFEDHINSVNRQATQLAVPWIGADAATNAYQSVSESLVMYRSQMYEAVKSTGLSNQSLHDLATGFKSAGINALAFGKDIVDSSEDSVKSSQFIADAALVVKGSGMSLSEGGAQLGYAMRNLGLDQRSAIQSLGVMAEVAGETGESLDKVRDAMDAGRRQLKFYGDTTEGVATVYTKLLKTVGEGKADWASEFLDTIIRGVGNMNEGLAAFIGQASGIGMGQGAIGSMLEVEEKIASGDIQGVLDAVTGQIESISGSKLLTRQEAIDTGKQDQFFLQRKLLENFGFGGGSREGTTRLLENLARGQQISAEQFSGEKGVEDLRGRGEGVIRAEEGLFGRGANFADAVANLASTERAAQIMFDSSAQFQTAVELVAKAIPKFADTLASINGREIGTVSNIEQSEKDLESSDSVRDVREEASRVQGEKADVRDVSNRIAAGANAEGRTVAAVAQERSAEQEAISDTLRKADNNAAVNSALPILENFSNSSKEFATSVSTLAESLKKFMEVEQAKAKQKDEEEKTMHLTVIIDPEKTKQIVKAQIIEAKNSNAKPR